MAKPTQQARLIAGLLALGYTEVQNPKTKKARQFCREDITGPTNNMFVGKAGSLRSDEFGRYSESHAMSDRVKAAIMAKGDELTARAAT